MAQHNSNRFLLLDVMRAFAVLMMIQGHTIDALLDPSQFNASSPVFQLWQVGRGLTAPIFLFGSGFAYVLASSRKSVGGVMPWSLVFRRVRWISVLFLVGALMHFPAPSLAQLGTSTDMQWRGFFQVDVLRLMSVTLLGLLILMLISRSRERLFALTSGMTALLVGLTPLMYSVDWFAHVPNFMVGFLSMQNGSFFPIFPFSAYLFAGAAAAAFYLRLAEREATARLLPTFAVMGAVSATIAIALQIVSPQDMLWSGSPFLFMLRLGLVLLMWAGFGAVIRRVNALPSFIPVVGQHTLLIYVAHVVFLYGCPWFMGINWFFGKQLSFVPVLAIIAALLVGSVALAEAMHSMKHTRAHVYKLVPYAGMVLLATVMSVL